VTYLTTTAPYAVVESHQPRRENERVIAFSPISYGLCRPPMRLNIMAITMSDNVFPISGIGEKRHGDESACARFALRLAGSSRYTME
jgi:hypothetical protein